MVNSITNANAYLEGNKLAGKISEMELPAIKLKMIELAALGLYADAEIPAGLEKLEAKIKWNCIYADRMKELSPFKAVRLTIKSNMQVFEAAGVTKNVPVVVTISGTFKELPLGTIKKGEKLDGLDYVMAVTYVKLEVDKQTVYEIDVFNNVFKMGEKDLLAEFTLNQ